MDAVPPLQDPPFRLWTTFTAQQIVLVFACPIAWFVAGAVSRARLLAVSRTPRYVLVRHHSARARGRTVSEDLPSKPFVLDGDGPAESVSSRGGKGKGEDGQGAVIDSDAVNWKEVVSGVLLCLLLAIDTFLIYVVADDWISSLFCVLFGACFGVILGHGVLWELIGPQKTYARRPDGSVVTGRLHDEATPSWTARLACYLAAFAVFPSLALTPKVLWVLVPFAMIPAHEERLGSKERLYVKGAFFSLLNLVMFGWLCWATRPLRSDDGSAEASSGVLYTEMPPDASPVFWVCLPEMLFVLGASSFVRLASMLYRFDYQPSLEEAEELQAELLSLSASGDAEGRKIAVPPSRIVVHDRARAHMAGGLRWGYWTLAVSLALVWLALMPVLGNLFFPFIPLSALMPMTRFMALIGAAATLAPAVYIQARLHGDLERLFAYEEHWGMKDSSAQF